jgi:tripartite-type tricarboxylate transporter receptor subunit TctC
MTKNPMIKRRILLGGVLAAPFAARADTWPSKPIRVILTGPVGGLIDVAGRAIGDAMQANLGQPWIIDPRPGANGMMAGQIFLASPADGYTLFLTVSGHVALNFLMKAPYDAMKDFQPIAMIGVSTALLCVPPTVPANNLAEFVAYSRANPGKLNYLNSANGTGAHLLPELMKIKYKLDITSVPYKGLPPGVQDLLAGRLQLAMVSTTIVMSHVKAGRLKAIGVVGPRRLADLPDVPTLSEQGAGDVEVRSSIPLYGHKDLAQPIVQRVNEAMRAALADSETLKHLQQIYVEPLPMTPAETAKALDEEHDRLGKVIAQLGIKADGGS